MPRSTYRRSRPKDLTWVTFQYLGKIDGSPNRFNTLGDTPSFLNVPTPADTSPALFNRPILLRASHVTGTMFQPYDSNFGDVTALIGVGFATPPPDITLYNQPKRFPLVAPAVPYARDASNTYYRIEGSSKSMRKIERGHSMAVSAAGYDGVPSNITALQLIIRCLFEVQ